MRLGRALWLAPGARVVAWRRGSRIRSGFFARLGVHGIDSGKVEICVWAGRCRLTVQGVAARRRGSGIRPGLWVRLAVHGVDSGKVENRIWAGRCGWLTVQGVAARRCESRIRPEL